jgi:hypothetical protein
MNVENRTLSGRSPRQWQAHVEMQIQAGESGRLLIDEMVTSGYAPADAHAIVSKAVRARQGKLGTLLGCSTLAVLFGVGTLLSAIAASETPQYIWIGGMVCGLVGIVYAISQLAKAR